MSTEGDPTDLRARTDDEAKATGARELEERIAADDLRWLMSQKQGRRFMWRLLGSTGVFRNPFTGNSETFFRCGEMNVGQRLMGQIHEHCPEQYHRMVKEQKDGR